MIGDTCSKLYLISLPVWLKLMTFNQENRHAHTVKSRIWTQSHTAVWLGRFIWVKISKLVEIVILNFNFRFEDFTCGCVIWEVRKQKPRFLNILNSKIKSVRFLNSRTWTLSYNHTRIFLMPEVLCSLGDQETATLHGEWPRVKRPQNVK